MYLQLQRVLLSLRVLFEMFISCLKQNKLKLFLIEYRKYSITWRKINTQTSSFTFVCKHQHPTNLRRNLTKLTGFTPHIFEKMWTKLFVKNVTLLKAYTKYKQFILILYADMLVSRTWFYSTPFFSQVWKENKFKRSKNQISLKLNETLSKKSLIL